MVITEAKILTMINNPKNRSRLTRITRNLLRIKAFSPFGLITSR